MPDETGTHALNGTAGKIIGAAFLVIGIVAGVYNMGAPDRQRIQDNKEGVDRALADVRMYLIKTEGLQKEIVFLKQQVRETIVKVEKGEHDHAYALAKASARDVQFTEVETQFSNLDERTSEMKHRADEIEKRMLAEDAELDRRLQGEIARSREIYTTASDVQPRLAVLEQQLAWIREKVESLLSLLRPSS